MKISRQQLLKEAAATGYRAEILEKVIHLLNLLQGFQSHPFLKGRIALKGGTALNLFVFDVPRLSVDIDLNYIGSSDREAMLAQRPKVEEAIQAVCSRAGMNVRRVPTDHAGGKWLLGYASAMNDTGNLEVDLNFMYRVPLWPIAIMDSRKLGSYQAKGIPVVALHELAAGKLAALLARRASRDLYDAHGLLCGGIKLDAAMLRLGFVVYGAMNRKDWRTVSLDDIAVDRKELDNELLPVLRVPNAAEAKAKSLDDLAKDLVADCQRHLKPIISFKSNEREFLDRLLDHGEILPTLLTGDAELAGRIASHPLLLWKAMNVRQHKKA